MRFRRTAAVAAAAVVMVGTAVGTGTDAAGAASTSVGASGCDLGNGVQHVISLVFDNVHFFRDNPNVPSDLEQMPHLLNFLKPNGTVLSNVHTPMIAHTADDSLSIYTGLYGDRHGQPLTNTYKTYNPDGTTDPATSFAYWTGPVSTPRSRATAGHDTTPTHGYSDTVPATGAPDDDAGAVGAVHPGRMHGRRLLHRQHGAGEPAQDIPAVFGPNSPEVAQPDANPDPFKDAEVADYIGVARALCAGRCDLRERAGGEVRPDHAVAHRWPDSLPTEPGGYNGYQALFGAKYVAPQLGAGTPNLTHNGYQVTNAAGNLVDLSTATRSTSLQPHSPASPASAPPPRRRWPTWRTCRRPASRSPTATSPTCTSEGRHQRMHDSDRHGDRPAGRPRRQRATWTTPRPTTTRSRRSSSGSQADGITPANTVFMISAEENDQFVGANVGRADQPTPAGCDGVTTPCHYAAGQIGELAANIKGLLSTTSSSGTQFDIEPQGASIYVHGQPAANDPTVRQLERDTAAMTANNPFSGVNGEKIMKYQAGAVEQRVLHMQTADPLRTPTYTMFPVPDYFFGTTGPNVAINPASSPGTTATTARTSTSPGRRLSVQGVAVNGVNGPQPADGNEASDPNSLNTVPRRAATGTWVEETDLRPTLLHLAGLTDDYVNDGAVVASALDSAPAALTDVNDLVQLYQQINSSVGAFATDTLIAESKAQSSGSAKNDNLFTATEATLISLADHRDRVAGQMKVVLANAAAGIGPSHGTVTSLSAQATALLRQAHNLAN